MVAILMMSANLATLCIRKRKYFQVKVMTSQCLPMASPIIDVDM